MENAGRNENIPKKRKSVFIGVPVFVWIFFSAALFVLKTWKM